MTIVKIALIVLSLGIIFDAPSWARVGKVVEIFYGDEVGVMMEDGKIEKVRFYGID
jgi:hypothetical protein